MLNYAVTLKEQGKSLEELTAIIEAEKLRFCHNFTVDDLHFLHRGGRVSKMTAIMGTALGIKPTPACGRRGAAHQCGQGPRAEAVFKLAGG